MQPPASSADLDQMTGRFLLTAAGRDLSLNDLRWHNEVGLFAEGALYTTTRTAALAWWEAEGRNVCALVRLCHDTGRNRKVWQFAETCKSYFSILRPYRAWEDITALALDSARAEGDAAAEAITLLSRAGLRLTRHDFALAQETANEARELWEVLGHIQGQASAYEFMGVALTAQGAPDRAIPQHRASERLHHKIGNERGAAIQKKYLGQALSATGRNRDANAMFAAALAVFVERDDDYQVCQTLIARVAALLAEGDVDAAEVSATDAVGTATAMGHRFQVAKAQTALARVHQARGDTDAQLRCLHEAHGVFADLGAPEAVNVRAEIARATG